MGKIDDLSLKVINMDVESIERERRKLRVAILQMLCVERLYKNEAVYDKRVIEKKW